MAHRSDNRAHSMLRRLCILCCSVLLLTPLAQAKDLPPLFEDFYNETSKYMLGEIDKEIKTLKKNIKSNDAAHVAAREDYKTQLAELKKVRKRYETMETYRSLYNGLKNTRTTVSDIATEWEKANGLAAATFVPEELNVPRLKTCADGLSKGLAYYQKISDLHGKIKQIDTMDYSPQTKKLTSGLVLLGNGMKEFGGKIPLLGSFIEGYGDVTLAFVDAVNGLSKKVKDDINQGGVGAGTRGVDDPRNVMWNKQGLAALTAFREQGFKHVYTETINRSHIYLWDPKEKWTDKTTGQSHVGRWWLVHTLDPPVGLAALKRRYKLWFEKAGIRDPTAKQILFEFNKAVELSLHVRNAGVVADKPFRVVPMANRALDQRAVDSVYVRVYDPRDPSVFKESRVGRSIQWTAPAKQGEHTLTAELTAESKSVWAQLGKGKLTYFVGSPTFLKFAARPNDITLDDKTPIALRLSLTDDQDQPLEKGSLVIDEPLYMGSFSQDLFQGDQLVASPWSLTWTPGALVDKPMTLTFLARYKGYKGPASGLYLTPAEDTEVIRVFEPRDVTVQLQTTRISRGKTFRIVPSFTDSTGSPVVEGTVRLGIDRGEVKYGTRALSSATLDLPLKGPFLWTQPEPFEGKVKVTVQYQETKSDKLIWYRPSRPAVASLPNTTELKAQIAFTAERAPKAGEWTVKAVLTASDGSAVQGGTLEIMASDGSFRGGQRVVRKTDLSKPIRTTWMQPARMTKRARIQAVYTGAEKDGILYSNARAVDLFLPDQLELASTLELTPVPDRPADGRWTIRARALTADGKPITRGGLEFLSAHGTFLGKAQLTMPVDPKGPVDVTWQAKPDLTNGTVSASFTDTTNGLPPQAATFAASSADLSLILTPDTTPPTLQITGVADGKTYPERRNITITATDDMPYPLVFDAHLLDAKNAKTPIIFKKVALPGNTWRGMLPVSQPDSYILDARVRDAYSNETAQVLSFSIIRPPREEGPITIPGSFHLSPAAQTYLTAYKAWVIAKAREKAQQQELRDHNGRCNGAVVGREWLDSPRGTMAAGDDDEEVPVFKPGWVDIIGPCGSCKSHQSACNRAATSEQKASTTRYKAAEVWANSLKVPGADGAKKWIDRVTEPWQREHSKAYSKQNELADKYNAIFVDPAIPGAEKQKAYKEGTALLEASNAHLKTLPGNSLLQKQKEAKLSGRMAAVYDKYRPVTEALRSKRARYLDKRYHPPKWGTCRWSHAERVLRKDGGTLRELESDLPALERVRVIQEEVESQIRRDMLRHVYPDQIRMIRETAKEHELEIPPPPQ